MSYKRRTEKSTTKISQFGLKTGPVIRKFMRILSQCPGHHNQRLLMMEETQEKLLNELEEMKSQAVMFEDVKESADSWTIQMSEDHIMLAAINGVLFCEKETLSQVNWVSDLGPGKVLNVYSLALTISGEFLVSSHNRFISINYNATFINNY